MDKSAALVKTGSDNIGIFVLYGTTFRVCQGGECGGWYREEGLSEPRKGRVCIEEVGCTTVLLRPAYAGARYTTSFSDNFIIRKSTLALQLLIYSSSALSKLSSLFG